MRELGYGKKSMRVTWIPKTHKRLVIFIFVQNCVICILFIPLSTLNYSFSERKLTYPGSALDELVDAINPQAEESALDYSLAGLVSTIALFLMYGIFKDLSKDWPTVEEKRQERQEKMLLLRRQRAREIIEAEQAREEISPQAEVVSSPEDRVQSENVTFLDAHPGYKQTVNSYYDPLRDAPLLNDASLDEFFSRPILISSFEWGVGTSLFEKFLPWQLYFENPRVINRIANYNLLRAKLCVKFTINGNAFHYGRIIASYNPLQNVDDMTVDRNFIDADVVAASQRPHVYLDPTNSQGGELCLPFFTPANLIDIPRMEWRGMGEMVLHSMQGLKHANGATDTVRINVFAWAEEVKFAIPTQHNPGAIEPQAAVEDEYGKRPVSRIAGAVANFASYLTEAPVIGPFARATQIGAGAVGAIASMFGYSSPANLEMSTFRTVPMTNYAVTNLPSDVMKLTLDAKQELTIDPRTAGLDNVDELAIANIVKHESYIASFPWEIGTAGEQLLFNIIVDPCVVQRFGSEIHMPATAFASLPFRYWRGTMKYRFQFVCSKYHKGRVKIVYDPVKTPSSGVAEYNTAYTTIVDISDTSDFSLEVGWGQGNVFREHVNPVSGTHFDVSPLTYDSHSQGNGTLAVYVVNELTVPNSTIDNDIEVNVFVSAGDDFEVAAPDVRYMENLKLRETDVSKALLGDDSSLESSPINDLSETRISGVNRKSIRPQAESEEMLKTDSIPVDNAPENVMAAKIPIHGDPGTLVYFGETIRSFRQLLKRFSRHHIEPMRGAYTTTGIVWERSAFPFHTGVTNESQSELAFPTPAGIYKAGTTSYMNYITSAYAGWRGGIRWMWDFSMTNSMTENNFSVEVGRIPEGPPNTHTLQVYSANTWLWQNMGEVYQNEEYARSGDGATFQAVGINPLVQFELPYQKQWRFSPAKNDPALMSVNDWDTGYYVKAYGVFPAEVNSTYIYTHCAAAEDFNCFFYLGPPIYYYQTAYPLSPEEPDETA